MTLDGELLDQAQASRLRMLELQHQAELARVDHFHAVRRLHAGGASMREIAEALGLSHQRIHQMIEEAAVPAGKGMKGSFLGRLRSRSEDACEEPGPAHRFERFAADGRQALVYAQEEAGALGHIYIGTEHLLLGLLRTKDSLAAAVLTSLGVELEKSRSEIGDQIGRCDALTGANPTRLTPRSKKALELALKEAKAQRHMHAGSEHLLLGIARVRDGVAARCLLKEYGVGEDGLRRRLARAALRCSFCGRPGLEVEHLVAGPNVFVCERCVDEATGLTAGQAASDEGGKLALATREARALCSFCGKTAEQTEAIVVGPVASICNECLVLCREIRAEEGS